MRFHGFPRISGVQGLPVFGIEMLPLKNLYSIPAGCDFIDFHDDQGFHEISKFTQVSGVQSLPACGGLWHRDAAPKETFTRSQLAASPLIFINFNDFLEMSWISGVGCSAAFAAEMLLPLDSSWLPFQRLIDPSMAVIIDRFIDSLMLAAGLLAGWLAGWLGWIG